MLTITRTSTGFESIHVHTGKIELSIMPELGGKINSLRDVRIGREWLWRHPRLTYNRVPNGSSYVSEADTGGWDECFPSVAACNYPSAPWQGTAIQDHGDLWSQVAEFEMDEQAESVVLRTRWKGLGLPYTFTRSITLTADSAHLRVDYAVTNNSDQPVNFIWCIHPLLAIEPGMELLLPASARFNLGNSVPSDNLVFDYPFTTPGLNLPRLPETSAGLAFKIWSNPLQADAGWAALCAYDGELRMRWDVAHLPQVAVWMNFGAWAGDGGAPYYNLGLEPCIGAQDSLADAVTQHNLFASLPPSGDKAWWLEVDLLADPTSIV
ncbi:MAG: hypothetical protein WCK35_02665 [Chloroflexota bacterium]